MDLTGDRHGERSCRYGCSGKTHMAKNWVSGLHLYIKPNYWVITVIGT
jgi:hypothetical protein